jgi:hypothetical protein
MTFDEFKKKCPWRMYYELADSQDCVATFMGNGIGPCTENMCGLWYLKNQMEATK